jgi:hypothetical protein
MINISPTQVERKLQNHEITMENFEEFRNNHYTIADSNYGLGIDIIESGLMNMLKFKMKKAFK